MAEERVACRTPAKGRDGVTNIPVWKFEVVEAAIRKALQHGPLRFSELREATRPHLSETALEQLGSLGWHVTTVKLEMEVRGVIKRLPGHGAQVIRLAE